MCCILACYSARPSLEVIRNITENNNDGAGVAWIDRNARAARWRKGLTSAMEVFELTQDLPLPFIVHARWATLGGAEPQLTHPFPVEPKPSLALTGKARLVLAHNGHVSEWRQIAKSIGLKLPPNPRGWSDTRVIAAMVSKHGKTSLKRKALYGQKFALLSAHAGLVIHGDFQTVESGLYASSYTGPSPWTPFRSGWDAQDPEACAIDLQVKSETAIGQTSSTFDEWRKTYKVERDTITEWLRRNTDRVSER